jgi:hypothetical protein
MRKRMASLLLAVTLVIALSPNVSAANGGSAKHELNLFVLYFNPYLEKVNKYVSECLDTDIDRHKFMQQYCDSFDQATDGFVAYRIAEWVEISELPYLLDEPFAPNPNMPDRFPYMTTSTDTASRRK